MKFVVKIVPHCIAFTNACHFHFSDIDNTLENMTTYKKNKWIIESKLRR